MNWKPLEDVQRRIDKHPESDEIRRDARALADILFSKGSCGDDSEGLAAVVDFCDG